MQFFNQFSFVLLLGGGAVLLALGLWRWRAARLLRLGIFAWYVFGALLLALALRYPVDAGISPATLAEAEARLNDDAPTFVMFYSNY